MPCNLASLVWEALCRLRVPSTIMGLCTALQACELYILIVIAPYCSLDRTQCHVALQSPAAAAVALSLSLGCCLGDPLPHWLLRRPWGSYRTHTASAVMRRVWLWTSLHMCTPIPCPNHQLSQIFSLWSATPIPCPNHQLSKILSLWSALALKKQVGLGVYINELVQMKCFIL
jgi:hypothetical protein